MIEELAPDRGLPALRRPDGGRIGRCVIEGLQPRHRRVTRGTDTGFVEGVGRRSEDFVYGTVARVRLQPGAQARLQQVIGRNLP
jgi:hypothetical protein